MNKGMLLGLHTSARLPIKVQGTVVCGPPSLLQNF